MPGHLPPPLADETINCCRNLAGAAPAHGHQAQSPVDTQAPRLATVPAAAPSATRLRRPCLDRAILVSRGYRSMSAGQISRPDQSASRSPKGCRGHRAGMIPSGQHTTLPADYTRTKRPRADPVQSARKIPNVPPPDGACGCIVALRRASARFGTALRTSCYGYPCMVCDLFIGSFRSWQAARRTQHASAGAVGIAKRLPGRSTTRCRTSSGGAPESLGA